MTNKVLAKPSFDQNKIEGGGELTSPGVIYFQHQPLYLIRNYNTLYCILLYSLAFLCTHCTAWMLHYRRGVQCQAMTPHCQLENFCSKIFRVINVQVEIFLDAPYLL